ncbi:hypothetical protein AX14_010000 [Amanita brunnescens Koide BX004]|nr:hypothetical protein AX14_010000 [Amanita brunnescens Koide BX004]
MVKLNFSSVFFILATAAALVFALPMPDENTSDVQANTPEGNIYNVATHLFISSDGAPGKKVVSSPHQKGSLIFDPPLTGPGSVVSVKNKAGLYIHPGPGDDPYLVWSKDQFNWAINYDGSVVQIMGLREGKPLFWEGDKTNILFAKKNDPASSKLDFKISK